MKRQSSDTTDKPVLDEGTFQQLLSAAFVLQQHKERLQLGTESESRFSKVLTQVLEIQDQIHSRRLDLQAATTTVARRIREFTGATGAAVGILDGDDLEYYAASGSASGELGSRAPFDLSLSAECLYTAQDLRSADAEQDSRLRPELCRPLGIRALIAVPIIFESKPAGVVELHFARANSFQDQDVRIAQLLASVLAEAIAKEKEVPASAPPEPAAEAPPSGPVARDEKAAMLAALEKIKPQLERLAGITSPAASGPPPAGAGVAPSTAKLPPTEAICESCGHPLGDDEPFCGVCGKSQRRNPTWSSLWDLQRAAENQKSAGLLHPSAETDSSAESLDVLPSELEDIVAQFSMDGKDGAPTKRPLPPLKPLPADASPAPRPQNGNGAGAKGVSRHDPSSRSGSTPAALSMPSLSARNRDEQAESIFPEEADDAAEAASSALSAHAAAARRAASPELPWTSEAKARTWFETEDRASWLTKTWRAQRANIYLAASAGVLVVVLFGWGPSELPVHAPGNASAGQRVHKAPPQPELSPSEKLLVGLGLAEAPAAPVYKGNPDTKVWIDLHTALYYCPGSDLYGKTVGGRFTTQDDAQQDSFQPASRRACD